MVERRSRFCIWLLLVCTVAHANVAKAQTPLPAPSCERPAIDARTLSAARPIPPPSAVQQHISGEVVVQITLDKDSNIVNAVVVKSASGFLNKAALEATLSSTFATRVVNCVPVGGQFNFIVNFVDPSAPHPLTSAGVAPHLTPFHPVAPAAMVPYFSGAWNCATADGSPSFRLFGLGGAPKSWLTETYLYGDGDGNVLSASSVYTQADDAIRVVGGRTAGVSSDGRQTT